MTMNLGNFRGLSLWIRGPIMILGFWLIISIALPGLSEEEKAAIAIQNAEYKEVIDKKFEGILEMYGFDGLTSIECLDDKCSKLKFNFDNYSNIPEGAMTIKGVVRLNTARLASFSLENNRGGTIKISGYANGKKEHTCLASNGKITSCY